MEIKLTRGNGVALSSISAGQVFKLTPTSDHRYVRTYGLTSFTAMNLGTGELCQFQLNAMVHPVRGYFQEEG